MASNSLGLDISSFTDGEFAKRAAFTAAPIVLGGVFLFSKNNRDWYNSLHHPLRVNLWIHFVIWIIVAVVFTWAWSRLASNPIANALFYVAVILQLVGVYLLFGQKDIRLATYAIFGSAVCVIIAAVLAYDVDMYASGVAAIAGLAYLIESFSLLYTYE